MTEPSPPPREGETAPWRHEARGRSALKFGLLAVGAALTGLALWRDAPWWVLPPFLAFTGLLAWEVAADRRYALAVEADAVSWRVGRRRRLVPLAAIRRLAVREWSDSTDHVLELADGGAETIPDMCLPGRSKPFHDALRARGVPVETA